MGEHQSGRKFSHDEAAALLRDAGAEPLTEYVNAHTPWPARCLTCGQNVSPRLSKIRSGQSPCRSCAIQASAKRRRDAHPGRPQLRNYQHFLAPMQLRSLGAGNVRVEMESGTLRGLRIVDGIDRGSLPGTMFRTLD